MELAHDALITDWPALTKQVRERRDDQWVHERLADDVVAWLAHARDVSFLYTGAELAALTPVRQRRADDLSVDEQQFLAASDQAERGRERARYLRQTLGSAAGAAFGFGLGFALRSVAAGQRLLPYAVLWNGQELQRAATSPTRIVVVVDRARFFDDLAKTASATILVENPGPGGGQSQAITVAREAEGG